MGYSTKLSLFFARASWPQLIYTLVVQRRLSVPAFLGQVSSERQSVC